MNKIILLEFNELCPSLLKEWINKGYLPNFKKFYNESEVFTTIADAAPPNLNPWVQWYSIHTGVEFNKHQVIKLTDGPARNFDDIWGLLLKDKRTVINCSSMNAKGFQQKGSMYLSDPWCTSEKAYPPELNKYQRYVSNAVQEHTSTNSKLSKKEKLAFLIFTFTHGLKIKTIYTILKQLLSEKLINKLISWKRPVLADKLQFDVFSYYFKKISPDFSTFFLNSTAHFQHKYWRYMEPEKFENKPSKEEISLYGNSILFGYQEMDKLLSKFFKFEDKNTTLVLATAHSQQPYLDKAKHLYRTNDVDNFLKTIGVSYEKAEPVMTEQFSVNFKNNEEKEAAIKILESLTYKGNKLISFGASRENTIFFGNGIHEYVEDEAEIVLDSQHKKTFRFYDLFYNMNIVKSGYHHPDGVLWFKTGNHKVHSEKVSVIDVMPTLLENYKIPKLDLQGKKLPLSWKKEIEV